MHAPFMPFLPSRKDISPPPRPTQMNKGGGPHEYSHFLRKGGNFWPFFSGRFPREKLENLVFLNQSPAIYWGIFEKLPKKLRKGGMIYIQGGPKRTERHTSGNKDIKWLVSVDGLSSPEKNDTKISHFG